MQLRDPLKRRSVEVIASLVGLSGCVTNPYIGDTRPEYSAKYAAAHLPALERGTSEYAWAYADLTYDAYQSKISQEFDRQQNLSHSLISIAGLAVGLAGGHAHSDSIKLAALAGGMTYQLGTWNSNQGRAGVYLEGMKAISCAKTAVQPLRMRGPLVNAMESKRESLIDAATSAAAAAGKVILSVGRIAEGTTGGDAAVQKANALLGRYNSALSAANTAVTRASAIKYKVNNAGTTLEIKIDEIRRSVDSALNGTVSDLSNLPKIISSTSDYANVFVPGINLGTALTQVVANASKPVTADGNQKANVHGERTTQMAEPMEMLAGALGSLEEKVGVLEVRAASLAGDTVMPGVEEMKSAMATCGVDIKVTEIMSISTSLINAAAGSPSALTVYVKGGTAPHFAMPLDPLPKDVDVRVVGPGIILVTIGAGAKVGSGRINVTDSAGQHQELTINIIAQ